MSKDIDPIIAGAAAKLAEYGKTTELLPYISKNRYIGPKPDRSEYFILNGFRIGIIPPAGASSIEDLNEYAQALSPALANLNTTEPEGYHPAIYYPAIYYPYPDQRFNQKFSLHLPTVTGLHEIATLETVNVIRNTYRSPRLGRAEIDLFRQFLAPEVSHPIVNKLTVVILPNEVKLPAFLDTANHDELDRWMYHGIIADQEYFEGWLGLNYQQRPSYPATERNS